jgi:hypothetical protein
LQTARRRERNGRAELKPFCVVTTPRPPRRIHDTFGIRYMNCGDWVESCTALAEHADGRFEIITWSDHAELLPLPLDDDEPLLPLEQRTGIAA